MPFVSVLPERAIELHFRATVEKTHSSTSIEGNPLTLKQVDSVLKGESLTRRKYAELEVRNYKKALDFIEKRKLTGAPLQYEDMLRLHELAMNDLLPDEKVGALRTGAVYIVDQDEKLKYTGPAARSVQKKTEELLGWIKAANESLHPCIASAILHYQFVSIHPFADGNGRTARLITMLYLGIRGYDFNGSIVLDSYYAQERSEYYSALQNCQGKKYREGQDLTPWVSYFASGFLSSAKVLWAEITVLSTLEPLFERKRISRDEADLLSYAKQFGSLSLSEAVEILPRLSRRTLQRKLKELTDNGYLAPERAGRSTRYNWRD
jgi:Fic family protein